MASNLTALIPSRKEALTGLLYAFVAFTVVLGFAYSKGKSVSSTGPSAVGSVALSKDVAAPSNATLQPLPQNWEEHTQLVDGLRLPYIDAQQKRPFDLYKRPVTVPAPVAGQATKPKLALLAMGLGFNAQSTQDILAALPKEAGIAIMPTAPYNERLYPSVINERRELWLHLPTGSQVPGVNEGINALRAHTPVRGNMDLLHNAMTALHYYAGVAVSPQSSLTISTEDMAPIMQEIGARGLGFIIPDISPSLALMQIANGAQLPFVPSGIDLNDSPLPDNIRSRLDDALTSARASGGALAVITDANPKAVAIVREWISLNKDQFTLVPPSALAQ